MANLIPDELNTLIQEYLSDGVLSDKERQVILKKAERMHLDREEVDLYLDAQVYKIEHAYEVSANRQKGKTCPFCGAPVPPLMDKCLECGQFVTPEATRELKEILENLEDALVDFKAGRNWEINKANVERYARKAKMYYSNNPKIKPLLREVEIEKEQAEKRAKSMARKSFFHSILSSRWFLFFLELLAAIIIIMITYHHTKSWRGFYIFIESIVSLYLLVATAKWAADD